MTRQHIVGRQIPTRMLRALLATTMMVAPCHVLAQAGANAIPSGAQPGQGIQAGAAAAGQAANPLINTPTGPGGLPPAATAVNPTAPAGATAAGSPTPLPRRTDAVSVLLLQANFWHNQDQPDRAVESLNRALSLDPRNSEALGLLAQIRADQGQADQANAALARLRAVNPGDQRITLVERQLRIGPISPSSLADARRLSQEGRNAESVQRYQQIFKDNPPPDSLSTEYFQTLAGTEGGWEKARDGVAQQVRDNPRDLRGQLAYAQILTYREGARAEGITRLAQLSQISSVAEPATRAWHQALLWLPLNAGSIPALTDYLRGHPGDAAIQKQLELARNPPRNAPLDAAGEARQVGFHELNTRNLAAAEREFDAALAINANDADALGGLGIVRLRQGRTGEARNLLNRAIAANPAKRGQWQAALNSINAPGSRGQSAPQPTAQTRAEQLRDQAHSASDPSTQEGLYRAALAADPANPWIRLDLARLLARRGRLQDGRALMAEATNGAHPTADDLRAGIIFANENSLSREALALLERVPARSRSAEMRALAEHAQVARDIEADMAFPPPVARERLLALAAAGPDPDGTRGAAIARALFRIGLPQDAHTAIATAQAVTRAPSPEARVNYANALLDIGDTAGAQQMLANLATGALSPREREAADQLGAGIAVRSADTLNGEGHQAEAYDRLAPALARTPDNPDLNLALARLYEGADKPQQALDINLAVLRRDPSNMVARKAAVDAAIAAGNRALADQLVREGIEQFPNDPRSWITSADLARARGNNLRALQDLQRAKQLRQQQIGGSDNGADSDDGVPNLGSSAAAPSGSTLTLAPNSRPIYTNSPPAATMTAQVAAPPPAYNDPGFAPPSYAPAPSYAPPAYAPPTYSAPTYSAPTYSAPTYAAPSYPAPSYTSALPAGNPFRSGGAPSPFGDSALPGASTDPMTAEIDRSIAELRTQVSPYLQAGTLLRGRSGTAGLDSLLEAAIPLEATFSPGGYGQLRLMAQPTYLSAGTLGHDPLTQSRFGLQSFFVLPSGGLGSAPVFIGREAGAQTATGVGLDLAYELGWASADIGTTPVGFPISNVIGGVELAPALTNDITLRLTGERRAITDSLLSYGGQREPALGLKFGGVTRTRGYAQLEFKAGTANFYAGAGYGSLDGTNVAHNNEVQAGAGGSFPIWKSPTDELRTGLDLVYFGFDKNLSYFTFGQGGYFSPQTYLAALIPLNYSSSAVPNLLYSVGGSVGLQTFNEKSSPYYPNNPGLQSLALVYSQFVQGLQSSYPGQTSSGFAGGVNAKAEYSLAPNLKVGGRASFQHAGNYNEGEGLIYARYIFNGAE
jgi:tetratricopeptide (TPR) repeat protein